MTNAYANPVAALVVAASWAALLIVMLTSRRPRDSLGGAAQGAKRDARSLLGILLQSLGIAAAWTGPVEFERGNLTAETFVAGVPFALLALASFGLFVWAAMTMGANWSLVARTRADHQLVQAGPFRWVRHPIYVALFGLMIATAGAMNHLPNLVIAIPLYVIGAWSRVGYEESLLRGAFGAEYEAYAARVKRYVPGLF